MINIIVVAILFVGLFLIGLILWVTSATMSWRKFVKPLWIIAAVFTVPVLIFAFLVFFVEIGFWAMVFFIVGLPSVGTLFAVFSAIFLLVVVLMIARSE